MPVQRWQRQWHNAGKDASACHDCFATGQTPACNAGSNAKATRAMMPAQQGKKAHTMRAMMPAQHRQQGQRNVGDDAGAMQQRMPAQRRQRHQCYIRRII
jgi:hypothetical protein